MRACRTPLHAAAFTEDVAGLQLVLRHGAEINAVDKTGRSALMVAADKGHSGTVGKSHSVLIHFLFLNTAHRGCFQWVCCTFSLSSTVRSVVRKCLCLGSCPAILLHRAKADLTLLDENRNTALHLACSKVGV